MGRADILGKALRILRIGVTVAGITAGLLVGWVTWSFLEAEVHGTTSGEHHHWDWD